MVAVNRGRHRDAAQLRLHELQDCTLAEDVLKNDAIRPEQEVTMARLQNLRI